MPASGVTSGHSQSIPADVVGDEFYYLATSNWPAYGDDGLLAEDALLAPLRIMSVALD